MDWDRSRRGINRNHGIPGTILVAVAGAHPDRLGTRPSLVGDRDSCAADTKLSWPFGSAVPLSSQCPPAEPLPPEIVLGDTVPVLVVRGEEGGGRDRIVVAHRHGGTFRCNRGRGFRIDDPERLSPITS